MSVAVCQSTSFASLLMPPPPTSFPAGLLSNWLAPPDQQRDSHYKQPAAAQPPPPPPPYVHPLLRRLSSLVSLETCTENLGSETGSDDFAGDGVDFPLVSGDEEEDGREGERREVVPRRRKDAIFSPATCRRASPPRSFPPPLPSISRLDGPCLHMRPHRRDGRLVVEAIPVPSQYYLHAERNGGRLLLSFVTAAAAASELPPPPPEAHVEETKEKEEEEELGGEEEEEDDEEEVEVVERGTVIEVKVSTPPQQQGGAPKVLRSSLVINKFVGAAPLGNQDKWAESVAEDEQVGLHDRKDGSFAPPPHRLRSAMPSTAAAAAESKVLFTSRRRNRAEVLRSMRRCGDLRRQLFIWEPYCVATTS